MKRLYLDYCASTPLHPLVLKKLIESSQYIYANPSSVHQMGYEASCLIEESRKVISELLNVKSSEVVFTSGATESNNMAIIGLIRKIKEKSKVTPHIIISQIEHPSVYNCCKALEKDGVEVTYVSVDKNGLVNVSEIEDSIRENTVLVSIMHVNNETGSIQPIDEIGELIQSKENICFHVDGVQGFGKVPLELDNIDLFTISGHKIGGPKGIGILVIKENIEISPIIFGGSQENSIRPGTTNLPGVVSITEAIKIALLDFNKRFNYLVELYTYISSQIKKKKEFTINSPKLSLSSPHILNLSYHQEGITSAQLINLFAKRGVILSSQSACSSKSSKLSRVLMAMSHNEVISSSSIRISLHETMTFSDADYLLQSIEEVLEQIKQKKRFAINI
ncbi:cysteine desulfurase [Paenibacillus tritici]|uniref:Cysteine desulfurase n=1 Tax=Paenibacillus tritici TaxID=1873425 RepID=A0ABX2DPT9_9BACL|nr:cysteine desulfurase family protein [Paenibacillus tritici]NQX45456.1 cysteine desulfurase [Paenibacillus tritici]